MWLSLEEQVPVELGTHEAGVGKRKGASGKRLVQRQRHDAYPQVAGLPVDTLKIG